MALFVSGKLFNKANVGEGGGGGGDQHNLGWYATESALTTAHPTAEAGDWAIVGATDTVWIWDTDNSQWVDSDQKGQVTSVNNQTGAVTITADDILPSQTGNSGKFLTTNGTSASWADALTNTATGTDSLTIGGTAATVANSTNIGVGSESTGQGSIAVGNGAKSAAQSVAIGRGSETTAGMGVAIGRGAKVSAGYGIQLGGYSQTNSEQGTLYVGSYYNSTAQNYKLLDANGTIPESRLADTTNAQQGDVLTLDANGDAVWQAGSGGLPSQTGNAGKFLTTDGTSPSWGGAVPLNSDGNIPIRDLSGSTLSLLKLNDSGTFINFKKTNSLLNGIIGSLYVYDGELSFSSSKNGQVKSVFGTNETCFYAYARNNNGADYDLGQANHVFSRTYTKNINNGTDITVPSVGGTLALQIATMPTAGSTYEGVIYQFTGTTDSTYTNGHFYKCVSDGQTPATYSWEEVQLGGGGGSTGTTASLVVANWSSNTQTVNVTGVTASNNVIVAPAPASQADYTAAGIICTAQGAGTLTFSCQTVPSSAITVNVLILG